MKEAFADDVIVFNNKGKEVKNIDPINWNPIMHQSHFNLHASQGSKNRKNKYTIIHRIHTSQSLATIRNYNTINSLLKQHSCYMREHSWAETTWDITQAGYLIGIDPKHYTPEAATKVVSDMMGKKSQGKCPPLRMIYSSPRIFVDDRNVSSKAFAIKYECKNAKEVIRKIKDTFAGSTQFLMAKLHYTHPKSFANALKMQNQIMNDTYVLPLINISPDEMFYLQPVLEQITGVIAVVSTRKTLTLGRYNILIPAGQFKAVKGNIIQHFPEYYNNISADAKQNPDALMFLGPPGIKVDTDNEDESSGAMSFLTTSAASFASFDMSTTADAFEIFTPAAGTYSWSDVAQRKSPPIPSEVTTPTPAATATAASHATSVLTPSERTQIPTNEIQCLREEYEEKLNSNASEIAELKTMLKQVLTTLQSLGVQVVSNPVSNPHPESMDTSNAQEMDIINAEEHNAMPKRGGTVSPSPEESGRHKRPDHKPSPNKQDFS
jgi:hypothetical protein